MTRVVGRAIVLTVLLGCISPYWCAAVEPPAESADEGMREPVPAEAELRAAVELIKQAYEDDFESAARDPGALVEKLLSAADQTQDLARRYGLLLAAEEAAAVRGDYDRAFEIIDLRAGQYSVDPILARLDRLRYQTASREKPAPDVLLHIFDLAVDLAENALAQERLTEAQGAAEVAGSTARFLVSAGKAKKSSLLTSEGESKQSQVRRLLRTVEQRMRDLQGFRDAMATLEADRADKAANESVGAYLCFYRDDWAAGLPLLALSAKALVADAASAEAAMQADADAGPEEAFRVAGKWWAAAEARLPNESHAAKVKQHAAVLYESALEGIQDAVDRAIAERRIRIGNEASGAKRKPSADAPEERDEHTLELAFDLDGSGVFMFRRDAVTYTHKHWSAPGNVTINGEKWGNLSETPPAWLRFAPTVRLASARVLSREARDTLAVEVVEGGFDVYVSDIPNGGARYSVTIGFPGRRP